MPHTRNRSSFEYADDVDYSRPAAEYVSDCWDGDFRDEIDFVLGIDGCLKGNAVAPTETDAEFWVNFRWAAAKKEYELMQKLCSACKTPVALDQKRHKYVGHSRKIKCMRAAFDKPAASEGSGNNQGS